MNRNPPNLLVLIQPTVEQMGYELVGIEYHPNSVNAILRIYIDKAEGIGIDDCEEVSRQISGVLDVHDPIASNYSLEVSSPGLDRPLFTLEHFQRFIGCHVRLQLSLPVENRRKWLGKIAGVENESILLEESAPSTSGKGVKKKNNAKKAATETAPPPAPVLIPFALIERAHLEPDFSK